MDSPRSNVLQRFQDLDSVEFRDEIGKLWDAGGKIVETVVDQVEDGPLMPVQGLTIIACSVAAIYGYDLIRGASLSAGPELLAALRPEAVHAS